MSNECLFRCPNQPTRSDLGRYGPSRLYFLFHRPRTSSPVESFRASSRACAPRRHSAQPERLVMTPGCQDISMERTKRSARERFAVMHSDGLSNVTGPTPPHTACTVQQATIMTRGNIREAVGAYGGDRLACVSCRASPLDVRYGGERQPSLLAKQ